MKTEIRQKWINALRSGKYKQGFGVLRNLDDEYCCLGVLADIIGRSWEKSGSEYKCDSSGTLLATSILNSIGLLGLDQAVLTELNDDDQLSFEAIADYIEENL